VEESEVPVVFLNYDQAALDAAYDQAAYAPNREQLIKRRICDSELARHRQKFRNFCHA
jgi:arylformamidase